MLRGSCVLDSGNSALIAKITQGAAAALLHSAARVALCGDARETRFAAG
jgi:hypothetical protein